MQVDMYNLLLVKNGVEPHEWGAVVYINVGSPPNVKVFTFKLAKKLNEMAEDVIAKQRVLKKCLLKGFLPLRTIQQWQIGSVGTVCHYCNFYGRCWIENVIDPRRKELALRKLSTIKI